MGRRTIQTEPLLFPSHIVSVLRFHGLNVPHIIWSHHLCALAVIYHSLKWRLHLCESPPPKLYILFIYVIPPGLLQSFICSFLTKFLWLFTDLMALWSHLCLYICESLFFLPSYQVPNLGDFVLIKYICIIYLYYWKGWNSIYYIISSTAKIKSKKVKWREWKNTLIKSKQNLRSHKSWFLAKIRP